MASVFRSYRFGIIALQSFRVFESAARPRCELKQRCGRHYSTSNPQPLGHGLLASDQELTDSKSDAKLAELKAMEETVTDPEIKKEIAAYYEGKRRLAVMMGCDPDTFTEKDVDDAIQYLLPSGLTAKDARPFLKHPLEYYPKKNLHFFDADGRPLEAGFYTGYPSYHNLVYELLEKKRQLDEKYVTVGSEGHRNMKGVEHGKSPVSSASHYSLTRWMNLDEIQGQLKEKISDEQYDTVLGRLKALAAHPMTETIQPFLDQYRRLVVVLQERKKRIELDENGMAYATGKRKTAEAEVTVSRAKVSGEGSIMINQSNLLEVFPLIQTRQQVLFPLMLVDALGEFDVTATVQNGGSTGQAGAIRHALSNALGAFSDDYYQTLDNAGLLRRDCRRKERKKPGQKKARKKFAWVKR